MLGINKYLNHYFPKDDNKERIYTCDICKIKVWHSYHKGICIYIEYDFKSNEKLELTCEEQQIKNLLG